MHDVVVKYDEDTAKSLKPQAVPADTQGDKPVSR